MKICYLGSQVHMIPPQLSLIGENAQGNERELIVIPLELVREQIYKTDQVNPVITVSYEDYDGIIRNIDLKWNPL